MLDNFRRKDLTRPGYVPPASAHSRMREALSPEPAVKPPEPAHVEILAVPATEPDRKEVVKPAPSVTGNQAEESLSRLIVGPDIKLKGAEITDCDTLVVEGRVEAAMDSRAIQIAEQGVFVGTAGVDVAEIRGRFEGELTVRKLLVIRSSGRVTGKIRYGKVSIEESGELSGDIASLGQTPATPATASHASPATARPPVPPERSTERGTAPR